MSTFRHARDSSTDPGYVADVARPAVHVTKTASARTADPGGMVTYPIAPAYDDDGSGNAIYSKPVLSGTGVPHVDGTANDPQAPARSSGNLAYTGTDTARQLILMGPLLANGGVLLALGLTRRRTG